MEVREDAGTGARVIGKQVGRYRLISEIGRGGMGVVYRATQVSLGRTVAVKMLSERLAASGEYLARFRREAETLARLAHPNIVYIYDVEEADGCHFIIMEFVEGPSLTQVLAAERQLSPARARDIALALAGALAAAHQKGIVHRDIKPDNILFSLDGRPKLTDFGIAHMRDSEVKTRTGVMLGTPHYMSPEQAGGRPVSAASDVYSLGIVIYEMLAGRVPFVADTPIAVALKHLKEDPPPLRRLVPTLSADLCRVVDRALQKNPGKRYPTAASFRRALGALELGMPPGAALLAEEGGEWGQGACPDCGTAVRADFLVCPGCGRSAPREAAPVRAAARSPAGRRSPARGRAFPALAALPASLDRARERVAARVRAAGVAGTGLVAAAGGAIERAGRSGGASRAPERFASWIRRLPGAIGEGRFSITTWLGIAFLGLGLLLAALHGLLAREGPPRSAADTAALVGPPAGQALGSIPRAAGGVGSRTTVFGPSFEEPSWRPEAREEPGAEDRPEAGSEDRPEAGSGGDGDASAAAEPAEREETEGSVGPDADHEDGAAAGTPAPDSKEEAGGFDEAAARDELTAVVERQRRATEAGDLSLFLRDIAPELRDGWRERFRALHEDVRDVRSRVRDVEISFTDRSSAIVEFHVLLTGRRRSDGRQLRLFDDRIRWELSHRDGRWLITGSSG